MAYSTVAPVRFRPGQQRLGGYEEDSPSILQAREEVYTVINDAAQTRHQTILLLRDLGYNADVLSRNEGDSNMKPTGLGIMGGLFTSASGIATILSGGAAGPILIASLAASGTVLGVGGGAWNIWNSKDHIVEENNIKERVKEALRNDDVAMARLDNMLQRVSRGCMGDQDIIFRELHMISNSCGTIAILFGAEKALEMLILCMPRLATFTHAAPLTVLSGAVLLIGNLIKEVTDEVSKELAEEIAMKAANEAVKNIAPGFTKNFAKRAAKEAAEKATKEVIELTGENIVKKGSNELATCVAKEVTEEMVVKKAADKAATKAVEEVTKTAAKVTGGITILFGGVTVLWEGANFVTAYKQSKKQNSTFGDELRNLANNMENQYHVAG